MTYHEITSSTRSTVMRETQGIKCRWFLLGSLPSLPSVSAKLYYFGFLRRESQSKFAEPFFQCFKKFFCISFAFAAHHKVVTVSDHFYMRFACWFKYFLKPNVQHIVQINVRE